MVGPRRHVLLFEERGSPPPHPLVIHLGGNDLSMMKSKTLLIQARDDLEEIENRGSMCKLFCLPCCLTEFGAVWWVPSVWTRQGDMPTTN